MVRFSTSSVKNEERPATITQYFAQQVTAPAANSELLTTGTLPVGNYDFEFWFSASDPLVAGAQLEVDLYLVAPSLRLQILGSAPAGTCGYANMKRKAITTNQCIKAFNGVAGAANSVYTVIVVGRLLT